MELHAFKRSREIQEDDELQGTMKLQKWSALIGGLLGLNIAQHFGLAEGIRGNEVNLAYASKTIMSYLSPFGIGALGGYLALQPYKNKNTNGTKEIHKYNKIFNSLSNAETF